MPGDKTRKIEDTDFSLRKPMKKHRQLSLFISEATLESGELKAMLYKQWSVLAAMSDYIADLMNEKNLRELLKVLLLEGWIDEKGMDKINTNKLNLAWKEMRKFNAQQSMNLTFPR